jgi:hypothetical protein
MGMTIDDILEHHGIKGMHWGSRKAKVQKTVKRRAKRFQANQKIKSKRQDIASRRRQLSERDLQKFIDRLQTEKKLKDLVSNDIKPGRTVTKRILSESGQKIARTVIAGGGILAVKAVIDKKMNKGTTANDHMTLLSDHLKQQLKKKK